MESLSRLFSPVQRLVEPHPVAYSVGLLGLVALSLAWVLSPGQSPDQPPALFDALPYVTNTLQYMTDMRSFLDRAT